jgi:hypothetical protein
MQVCQADRGPRVNRVAWYAGHARIVPLATALSPLPVARGVGEEDQSAHDNNRAKSV